jgi:hypothetical protein
VWCRVAILDPSGVEWAAWRVPGRGAPDLDVADSLARLQLAARRGGRRLVLQEVCPELDELLELTGLRRELVGRPRRPPSERLGGELLGEAEGGEEGCGVEKRVDGHDPPV